MDCEIDNWRGSLCPSGVRFIAELCAVVQTAWRDASTVKNSGSKECQPTEDSMKMGRLTDRAVAELISVNCGMFTFRKLIRCMIV